MTLRDDAKLVVDAGGCPWCGAEEVTPEWHGYSKQWGCFSRLLIGDDGQLQNVPLQTKECKDRQITNLTARLETMSADLAEHKRRLGQQSATLNAVRQERDELKRAYEDCLGLERKAGSE